MFSEIRNSFKMDFFAKTVKSFYPAGIYLLKVTIETLEQGVKYVKS